MTIVNLFTEIIAEVLGLYGPFDRENFSKVLNITRQEPTEVPGLWPCVAGASVGVVTGIARNKQRHGQPNLVLS